MPRNLRRVTITIQDKPDGGVSVSAVFDPPLKRDGEATLAQKYAVELLTRAAKDGELETDSVEP